MSVSVAGPVLVVGVDASASSGRALAWAVHYAAAQGGTIRAVLAYRRDDLTVAAGGPAAERARGEQRVRALVDATLAELGVSVPVTAVVADGAPVAVLTAAARDADLLVLGARSGGLVGWLSGSTRRGCERRAVCPVVVIPPGQQVAVRRVSGWRRGGRRSGSPRPGR